MPLTFSRPDPSLLRELEDVADHADVLIEYLRQLNTLPASFPKIQLLDIAEVLRALPKGTAEGCRIPLEYARLRLPAIRREHVTIEDQSTTSIDDKGPPPLRGMALDRALSGLIASVTTALDQYRAIAHVPFDVSTRPESIATEVGDRIIASAMIQGRDVQEKLAESAHRIEQMIEPGANLADQLLRRVRDAEGLIRTARSELRMRTIVIRWFKNIVSGLRNYPNLLRKAGSALRTTVDISLPFIDVWREYKKKHFNLLVEGVKDVGKAFDTVADLLDNKDGGRSVIKEENKSDFLDFRPDT